MDVRATFGDSGFKKWLNYLTLWAARPVLRTTFEQYLIAFYSRLETTSGVLSIRFVGPVVADNCVKFGDPRLNLSREIHLKPSSDEAFSTEVDNSDVISGAYVGQFGMDVPVKFRDSSSIASQDIRPRSCRKRHFRRFYQL